MGKMARPLLLAAALFPAHPPLAAQFVARAPSQGHEYADFLDALYSEFAVELDSDFGVDSEVGLTSAECGQANAFYVPDEQLVVLCVELLRDIHQGLANLQDDASLQALALTSQVAFVLVHEVGHALVHVLDLPIVGQEEDAVDQLATIFLADEPVLTMWAAEYWRGSPTGGGGRYISAEAMGGPPGST